MILQVYYPREKISFSPVTAVVIRSFPVDDTHKSDKWSWMTPFVIPQQEKSKASVFVRKCVPLCPTCVSSSPNESKAMKQSNARQGWHCFKASAPFKQAGFNQSALHPRSQRAAPPVPTTDTQPANCTSSFNPSAKEYRSSISTVPPSSPHHLLHLQAPGSSVADVFSLSVPSSLHLTLFLYFSPTHSASLGSCNSALAQTATPLFGTCLALFVSFFHLPAFILSLKHQRYKKFRLNIVTLGKKTQSEIYINIYMKGNVEEAMSKLPVRTNPQNMTLWGAAFIALLRSMARQQHGLGICVRRMQALYCGPTWQQYNHNIMKVLLQ